MVGQKTLKSVKIFPLEKFRLYGMLCEKAAQRLPGQMRKADVQSSLPMDTCTKKKMIAKI